MISVWPEPDNNVNERTAYKSALVGTLTGDNSGYPVDFTEVQIIWGLILI